MNRFINREDKQIIATARSKTLANSRTHSVVNWVAALHVTHAKN